MPLLLEEVLILLSISYRYLSHLPLTYRGLLCRAEQEIIKFKVSKPMREYLSCHKCSATLLNFCFERPLGIIRSDQASSKSAVDPTQVASSSSVSEILALHGVRIGLTVQKRDSEDVLLQDIEAKQKKVQSAQKEVSLTKELLQTKLASVVSLESHRALEEARMQEKIAQTALERAMKDLNESKQRYAAEIAQPTNEGDKEAEGKDTPRPMSLDALELQYQGLQLVATLVAHDKNYICEHIDVVKAFRLLWRSKGRYLRLQHEEFMPPRFHDESTMLVSFLVNTASAFPKYVDILYELLRIFLQPTTSDFSFVRDFLIHTVAYKLSVEQKRNLMKRLFSLLVGDGNEETKTVSIELIGIPMIASSFPLKTSSVQESPADKRDSPQAAGGSEEQSGTVLDQDMITKFATHVLFKDGSPAACGDQLRVELLRLSTLLLERVHEQLAQNRKEIIKFSWSLLKSDDSSCKNWACVNLCRFISVFETPPKNVVQVYVALLRTYQQEGKDLVRSALAILIPVLPDRLPPDDFQKMIDSTIKIMFEEGNSAPQLAHVWHTIIAHINIFYEHRQRFFRHMINSINRLGLPPNCPIENRTLAVTIVELVLEWDRESRDKFPVSNSSENVLLVGRNKRKEASNEYRDASVHESNKRKRRSNAEGEQISISEESVKEDAFVLDEEMVSVCTGLIIRRERAKKRSRRSFFLHRLKLSSTFLYVCAFFLPIQH
jgi:transformation/transcription domain-associated protein